MPPPAPEATTDRPMVLLASTSPRRRAMLAEAGVAHLAASPGVDDGELDAPEGVDPAVWVMGLAHLKARAGLALPEASRCVAVLGADTVCVRGPRIIGQPRDEADAAAMIAGMAQCEHEVLTGVALVEVGGDRRCLFVERAVVRVGVLPDAQVRAYVASGQWRGKAGGYNLRERLGAGWPITWEGDEGTIVGLPMARLMRVLPDFLAELGAPCDAGVAP